MYLPTLISLLCVLSSSLTNAEPLPKHPKPSKTCPCYTATAYASNPACPIFKPEPPCIYPMCLMLSTTTIPATNTACPTTRTETSLIPCETACRRGCATATSTETFSSSCLPPTPSSSSQPSTQTAPHTRPCFTHTVTSPAKCPEETWTTCAVPDCIYLSTTTVPGGPVAGCSVTPTETITRSCLGRCDWGCRTEWTTETATAW